VNSIKTVIQAAESIQEGEEEEGDEPGGDVSSFDVVQDMRAANKALQAIFMCFRQPIAQDVFLQSAKVSTRFLSLVFLLS
jgi:hypothetical protein